MRFFGFSILFMLAAVVIGQAQNPADDSLESILKTFPGDSQKAAALNKMSLELRTSDFAKAIRMATKAQELADRSGIRTELAKSYLNKGVAEYYAGNYPEALGSYQKSISLYERINDKLGQATALNELGTFNKHQGDTARAFRSYKKALELSTVIKNEEQIANSLNNLGLIYELRDDNNKALDFYQRSAKIKEDLHDLSAAAYNYDNIGGLLARMNRFPEAREYFDKVIAIRKSLGDKTGLSISTNNLGEMYMMQGNPVLARKYFESALALTLQIEYKDLRRHIYNMIAETYQKENNYKTAYDYFNKSAQVKDSIFSERKQQQILQLQTSFEHEKQQQEIQVLKAENELKDYRLNENRVYFIALILLVPVLFMLGYLWLNRSKLRQQAELQNTRASLRESQLQAVISSQEKERKRFAADLHDGLGQMISALHLSLSKENPEKYVVDHALTQLNEMNGEIRNIAFNLMPQVLMKGGLDEALDEFAGRVNRFGFVFITVLSEEPIADIPSEHKIALYRVCQEWVNNAMKYSDCTTISLELVQHPDEIVIIIEDNGKGFDKDLLILGEGNGWKNISSRLAMLKGSIEINSRPGHLGTTAVISSPMVLEPA